MKKLMIVSSILFFIILNSTGVLAEKCKYSADIYLELIAYEELPREVSSYQFPDYKEDTLIYIKNFTLENTGNCSLYESFFNISIIKPSGEKAIVFCSPKYWNQIEYSGGFRISYLEPEEKYEIVQLEKPYDYVDSLNISKTYCGIRLDEIGKWTIEGNWDIYGKNETLYELYNTSSHGYNFRVHGSFLKKINVNSRYDIEVLKTSKDQLILAFVVFLITMSINISISIKTLNSQKEGKKILDKIYKCVCKKT